MRPWNFRFRSLLSRILWRSRIHGCRSLFRSCYFSADRKSAKGPRVAERFTRPEIKHGQLHEEGLKLLKLIRVIADEVQSSLDSLMSNEFLLSRFLIEQFFFFFYNTIPSYHIFIKLVFFEQKICL